MKVVRKMFCAYLGLWHLRNYYCHITLACLWGKLALGQEVLGRLEDGGWFLYLVGHEG